MKGLSGVQIETSFGPHVQAIMVFRDTKKRLMWVASPYGAEFTRDMLDHARDNFSETPVEHIYERYERKD